MSNASTAAAGIRREMPPVSGRTLSLGMVSSMTPSLADVVLPAVVVPDVEVVSSEVVVPVVSLAVVVPVVLVPVVVPVVSVPVVPVVMPVVVVVVGPVVVVVTLSSGRQNATWVTSKISGCARVPPVVGPMGSSGINPDLITRMTGSDEVKVTSSKLTVPEIVTVVLSTVKRLSVTEWAVN